MYFLCRQISFGIKCCHTTRPGIYTLELTGTHPPHSGVYSSTFHIVDQPPLLSLPYTVSDTIFCQQGETEVTILDSDAEYRYRLYREADALLLDEASGNGENIVLSSGILTDSCRLVIAITSVLADCERWLQPSIPMHVEHTRASFNTGFLNAKLGEATTFFNTSAQAATFQWSFSNAAVPAQTTAASPVAMFNVAGTSEATLIATSAYGCTDTLTAEGPFVYNEQDYSTGCWAFRSSTWVSSNTYPTGLIRVTGMVSDTTNRRLYVAAASDRSRIESRAGRSFDPPDIDHGGDVLARYDENGMLKWCVYGGYPWQPGNVPEAFTPSLALSRLTGDVFIHVLGYLYEDTMRFVDGEKYFTSIINTPPRLFRVDSLGRKVWSAFVNLGVFNMMCDEQDNLYLLSGGYGTGFGTEYVSPSGVTTSIEPNQRSVLLKLDPQGEFLWTATSSGAVFNNSQYIAGLAIDGDGNVLIAGNHSSFLTFYSANGEELNFQSGGNSANFGFLIKYDQAGNILWGHQFDDIDALKVAVDPDGNAYLSMQMWQSTATFPSNGGPPMQLNGQYAMLSSYSPTGLLRWVGTANAQVFGSDVTITARNQVVLSGTSYALGVFDGFGNVIDSIWTAGGNNLTSVVRWATDGLLHGITTLEGDTSSSHFATLFAIEGHRHLAPDTDGGVWVGLTSRYPYEEEATMAGDPIQSQAEPFMILVHMDTLFCDTTSDFTVSTYFPSSTTYFQVYPVPAKDMIMVRTGSLNERRYRIMDALGREVKRGRSSHELMEIDISMLKPGVYRLEVSDFLTVETATFVKE